MRANVTGSSARERRVTLARCTGTREPRCRGRASRRPGIRTGCCWRSGTTRHREAGERRHRERRGARLPCRASSSSDQASIRGQEARARVRVSWRSALDGWSARSMTCFSCARQAWRTIGASTFAAGRPSVPSRSAGACAAVIIRSTRLRWRSPESVLLRRFDLEFAEGAAGQWTVDDRDRVVDDVGQ